jgi:quercetin dioxygenase-like cupin family protein
MVKTLLMVGLGMLLGAAGYALAMHEGKADKDAHSEDAKHKVVLEQILKEKLDGKQTKVTVWELERAAGKGSPPHRHPGPVLGYVLEGELEVALDDGPVKTYKAGQMWYEPARVLHRVSRNPGKKKARFLAIMFTDKDEKTFVLPEKK